MPFEGQSIYMYRTFTARQLRKLFVCNIAISSVMNRVTYIVLQRKAAIKIMGLGEVYLRLA